MAGNKSYLVEYQDFNGGPVAFGGSKGQITGKGPTWLFDLDYLTDSMNYQPVTTENKANKTADPKESNNSTDDYHIPTLEDIYEVSKDGIFTSASYDDEGVVVDFTNLESTMNISAFQTRSKVNKSLGAHAFIEPKTISQALEDESWKVIGTKWVYRNKKDVRGVVVRNKARLVAQGHRQEEEIDYDEVFAPVARIEAISVFLAIVSYMGFIVYQMDVKSAFLYGKIDEEVYVSQTLGFIGPKFLKSEYKRGLIDKTLFIKKDKMDIMQIQVYVDDIIFGSTKEILTASTPIETKKPLVKDTEDADVDVHLYRSMIGYLMYLTASRLDIMYAVCTCSRFQFTSKTSHLQAVKRIFRYLKGQPKLVLWYARESGFDLEAYSDNDYARANIDRKSTTRGCQFLGRRLISWQYKKKTIVATSTTKERIVLNLPKINQKSDNINTRMEIRNKSRISKQFSQNNLTLKLKISKIQVQGPFLPKDQS
nr:hypothetical protein [Tanacetum cinerariifolium]